MNFIIALALGVVLVTWVTLHIGSGWCVVSCGVIIGGLSYLIARFFTSSC